MNPKNPVRPERSRGMLPSPLPRAGGAGRGLVSVEEAEAGTAVVPPAPAGRAPVGGVDSEQADLARVAAADAVQLNDGCGEATPINSSEM
jgi:hypothetical protein